MAKQTKEAMAEQARAIRSTVKTTAKLSSNVQKVARGADEQATGSGQLAKMVNQICIAGTMQGLAEAYGLMRAAGLDIEAVTDVISKGAAQSWQMENRYKTMNAGEYNHGFAVEWMRKDLGICLAEARRNVPPVAQKVPLTLHHVGDRNPDPVDHAPARGKGEVAGADALLQVDGAAHRVDRAWKLRQHRITGRVEDAAPPTGDRVVEYGTVGGEAAQRLLLVLGDELAVARDIGRQNGGNFAFHGWLGASPRSLAC